LRYFIILVFVFITFNSSYSQANTCISPKDISKQLITKGYFPTLVLFDVANNNIIRIYSHYDGQAIFMIHVSKDDCVVDAQKTYIVNIHDNRGA